jgi:hypothetical protein
MLGVNAVYHVLVVTKQEFVLPQVDPSVELSALPPVRRRLVAQRRVLLIVNSPIGPFGPSALKVAAGLVLNLVLDLSMLRQPMAAQCAELARNPSLATKVRALCIVRQPNGPTGLVLLASAHAPKVAVLDRRHAAGLSPSTLNTVAMCALVWKRSATATHDHAQRIALCRSTACGANVL